MDPWNVVVTCRRNGERGARKELRFFGRFHSMGFRDVLVGHVEDCGRFLDELLKSRGNRDPLWRYVVRLVPIDVNFGFTLETFRERLAAEVDALAERVPAGPFYVRLERRGHKGEIPTPEIEREMDGRIIAVHERAGLSSRVDFKEFLSVVAVEVFGDAGGIGVIRRETTESYPFVRIP